MNYELRIVVGCISKCRRRNSINNVRQEQNGSTSWIASPTARNDGKTYVLASFGLTDKPYGKLLPLFNEFLATERAHLKNLV